MDEDLASMSACSRVSSTFPSKPPSLSSPLLPFSHPPPSPSLPPHLSPPPTPNRRISALARSSRTLTAALHAAPLRLSLSNPNRSPLSLPLPIPRRNITMSAATPTAAAPAVAPIKPERIPNIILSGTFDPAWKGDLAVVGVFEEHASKDDATLAALDAALGGAVSDALAEELEFKGKPGSTVTLRTGAGGAKYVTLVGLGPKAKGAEAPQWGTSVFQKLGEAAAAAAKANKAKTVGITFIGLFDFSEADRAAAAARAASGLLSGSYEDLRFKSKQTPAVKTESAVLAFGVEGNAAAVEAVKKATEVAVGGWVARHLVNAPPNVCKPSYLAEAARQIAEGSGGSTVLEVLERSDCEKLGMGLYLGVAEASEEPPKFIHLTYKPQGEVKKVIAVVGKGLTFDSGGYNLKAGPGSMIEMMKFDMGGSAATLGAAHIVSQLKPEGVEVHFIVAACENMVDGKGLRPGDIITASNGKTVEVNNTDAEGRLTLADAMIFAERNCKAEAIVDIATLTGACIVGLGTNIAAFYTYKDNMADALVSSSRAAGEKIWRMPLEEPYWDSMKSPCADMKNTGSRWGGSITAALFLKEYVSIDKVEWAHIDMAGPVWNEKEGAATGFGAGTLAEWVFSESRRVTGA